MLLLGALACALVCLAAGIGTPAEMGRDRRALALAALQLAGGGLTGWLIGWLFGLTGPETAALVLIGVAPGTAGAAPLAGLAGGDMTVAHGMASRSGIAGLAATGCVAALAPDAGAAPVLWLVVAGALPLWAGLRLRGRVPAAVQRAVTVLSGAATGLLVIAALVFGTAGAALWPLSGAVLAMIVALSVAGHAAGRALGGTAAAVAGAAALPMRNVAVPLLAGFAAGMPAAPLAAGVMGIAMYLPAIAMIGAMARRNRRR